MVKHGTYLTGLVGLGMVSISACSDDEQSFAVTSATAQQTSSTDTGAGAATSSTTGAGAQGGGGSAPAGTCADPILLMGVAPQVMGNTTGAADNLFTGLGGQYAPQPGAPDLAHTYEAAASGRVRIDLSSPAVDLGYYVRHDCESPLSEFAWEDMQLAGMGEYGYITVVAGHTYSIIVDGFTATDVGPYGLTLGGVMPEGNCSNGADDNNDRLVDCADPSCLVESACVAAYADACSTATPLTPGVAQNGDTTLTTASDAFSALNLTCGFYSERCAGADGAMSQIFSYTPATDEALSLVLSDVGDHGLFIRTTCDDPTTQVLFHNEAAGGPNSEHVFFHAKAGQTYSIFVAAESSGMESAFTIDPLVFPIDEVEPNDAYTTATTATDATPLVGFITTDVDEDWYVVNATAAGSITAATSDITPGDCDNLLLDTDVAIYDSDGTTLLAENDDISTANFCSAISASIPSAGTYYVRVAATPTCALAPIAVYPACRSPYTLTIDAP